MRPYEPPQRDSSESNSSLQSHISAIPWIARMHMSSPVRLFFSFFFGNDRYTMFVLVHICRVFADRSDSGSKLDSVTGSEKIPGNWGRRVLRFLSFYLEIFFYIFFCLLSPAATGTVFLCLQ